MMADYKASKEAFVSGMSGSSVVHVNLVSLAALTSIALHSACRSRQLSVVSPVPRLGAEYALLVIPLLLSMTFLADHIIWLNCILMGCTLVVVFIPRPEQGTPLPSNLGLSPISRPSSPDPSTLATARAGQLPEAWNMGDRTRAKKNVIPMVPALTTYRAHMMLMTTLAILAVDFPIFPRALAKCETFGVSLMDIGVGSFVFSQGVVSALPVLKNPDHLYAYPLPKIMASARKVLPILALGLIRVVLVKGVDYPEHVSEYGVHWNFFVTLAVLPVVQTALDPLIARFSITSLGVLVATAHQTTLSYLGGSHYILEAPRIGIISANKEGILSLPGYLSIHLLGLSLGTILLPPDPNFLRKLRRRNQASNDGKLKASSSDSEDDDEKVVSKAAATEREPGKTAIELCSYAIVWWTLLGLCQWTSVGGGVSRRMANLPYILWVAAYNTTFILGYFALDMWFFSPPSLSKLQSRSRPSRGSLQGQGYETTSPVRRSVTPEPQAWASTSTYASAGKSSSSRRPAYARDDSRYARLEIPPTPTVPVWDQSENSEEVRAPALLDAINRNGLMIFLLANLATGLVNLTMPTMYMSDGPAMTVLVGYSLALSAAAWFMRSRRIIKL